MTTDKERALAAKNDGNKAFLKHDWPAAIDLYSQAITLDGAEPTYFANRAQVRIYSAASSSCARVTGLCSCR